jgi:hypothetical protein
MVLEYNSSQMGSGQLVCGMCHCFSEICILEELKKEKAVWIPAPINNYERIILFRRQGDTIATVMATSPPNVSFRRVLLGQRLVAWNTLIQRLGDIHLSPEPDEFR